MLGIFGSLPLNSWDSSNFPFRVCFSGPFNSPNDLEATWQKIRSYHNHFILGYCGSDAHFLRLAGVFPENSSSLLLPLLMFFAFLETSLAIMSGIFFAAMFADLVEENQINTKRRSEGLYYSASSFTKSIE